jgi:hypothetical protein
LYCMHVQRKMGYRVSKAYLESRRTDDGVTGKYRYEYHVECRVCTKQYWTKTFHKEQPRCKSCAGTQSYQPSKVERKDARKYGDGYITKQGYLLVYDGEKYVPAHRMAFKDLPEHIVVHHIDGDKLNNVPGNLVPLTKQAHREAHGSLERVTYDLIQAGLVEYCRDSNSYSLSTTMKEFMVANPVNSGKPQTDDAVGNPEPSQPKAGRCNDYPVREYT